jgi:hypothetical protein
VLRVKTAVKRTYGKKRLLPCCVSVGRSLGGAIGIRCKRSDGLESDAMSPSFRPAPVSMRQTPGFSLFSRRAIDPRSPATAHSSPGDRLSSVPPFVDGALLISLSPFTLGSRVAKYRSLQSGSGRLPMGVHVRTSESWSCRPASGLCASCFHSCDVGAAIPW